MSDDSFYGTERSKLIHDLTILILSKTHDFESFNPERFIDSDDSFDNLLKQYEEVSSNLNDSLNNFGK